MRARRGARNVARCVCVCVCVCQRKPEGRHTKRLYFGCVWGGSGVGVGDGVGAGDGDGDAGAGIGDGDGVGVVDEAGVEAIGSPPPPPPEADSGILDLLLSLVERSGDSKRGVSSIKLCGIEECLSPTIFLPL